MKKKLIAIVSTIFILGAIFIPIASANEVSGNVGNAWCYMHPVGFKKASVTIGCDAYFKKIATLTYYISYTGGAKSNDYGVAFPFSSTWSTCKVPEFSRSGIKTATYSGNGIFTDGTGYTILNPISTTYVY